MRAVTLVERYRCRIVTLFDGCGAVNVEQSLSSFVLMRTFAFICFLNLYSVNYGFEGKFLRSFNVKLLYIMLVSPETRPFSAFS